jgi:hypothetical protein
MANTPHTASTVVDIRVPLPFELHEQLRQRAFIEHSSGRAVVVAALRAWLAPSPKHAQPAQAPDLDAVRAEAVRHVIELFDRAHAEKRPGGGKTEVLAYLDSLGGPS